MNRLYLWLQHHPCVVDSMIATLLGLFLLLGGPVPSSVVLNLVVYVALLIGIALRRKWFTAAFLVVTVASLVTVVARGNVWLGPAHLAVPILIYTAAAIGPSWARRLSLLAVPVAPVLALWSLDAYGTLRALGNPPPSVLALLAALLAAPLAAAWVWGDSTRTKRLFYEELADRAYRLEREREALDRAIVAEERARIARELHDIVAHHVSVMVVQADGAAYAIDTRPDQAREALRTISRTGREAMREMRTLLGVLRGDDGPDRTPQPGLDAIDDLIAQVRATGLPVDYAVVGRSRPVPSGVGLIAYRVIQEALTNALKHGGPGVTASVRLEWTRDRLRIEVTDDGGAASAVAAAPTGLSSGGHGIVGMRERVASIGGRFQAGARPDGGYRVTATLPLGRGRWLTSGGLTRAEREAA